MHYKLLGFSHTDSVRHFVFQRVFGYGMASAEYTMIADVALARTFGITMQELPSLCSRLLEARPEDLPSATILLTDTDLRIHAAANLSAAQQDKAKRGRRSRQGAIAVEGGTEDNVTPQHSIIARPVAR